MSRDYWRTLAVTMSAGVVLGTALSCATQRLAFMDAAVRPAEVAVGKSAVLTVNLLDRRGAVQRVIATVREVPELEMELFDDGQDGDDVAGDGVWSIRLDVPPTAPPGTYHFDIRAYDKAGNELVVENDTGAYVPLRTETSVAIVF